MLYMSPPERPSMMYCPLMRYGMNVTGLYWPGVIGTGQGQHGGAQAGVSDDNGQVGKARQLQSRDCCCARKALPRRLCLTAGHTRLAAALGRSRPAAGGHAPTAKATAQP